MAKAYLNLAKTALLFVAISSVATPALAQESDRERAVELFEEGERSYRAGDFDGAIGHLDAAYRIFPEPVILYNLGRAHEGRGDDREAADYFERYLAEAGEVEDRGGIEARIQNLRASADERDRLREEASAAEAETNATAQPIDSPDLSPETVAESFEPAEEEPRQNDEGSNAGLIVGVTVGALVVAAAVVLTVVLLGGGESLPETQHGPIYTGGGTP